MLDFYVSFPERGGAVLGAGHGLEGAILLAMLDALVSKSPGPELLGRGASGTAVWLPLRESGRVNGGEDAERVELQPEAKEALLGLAAVPAVKRVVLPQGLVTTSLPDHEKIEGVSDVEQLLALVCDMAVDPVQPSCRVMVSDVQVFKTADKDQYAAGMKLPEAQVRGIAKSLDRQAGHERVCWCALRQVLGTASVRLFTPAADSMEIQLNLTRKDNGKEVRRSV